MKLRDLIILVPALLLLTVSCKTETQDVKETLTKENWHIVTFLHNNKKMTQYGPYNLRFMAGNRIVALNGGTRYEGEWEVYTDIVTDDMPTETNMEIKFTKDEELSGLNGRWVIVEHSASAISLDRLDMKGNETDRLMFEKI